MIQLVDHYVETPTKVAIELEALDSYLGEHEDRVLPCTCEDGDIPRGWYESDTNAYNHHPDCPQGLYYHYHVYLAGMVRYLREEVQQL